MPSMDKMIACQISYIPVNTVNVGEAVKRILPEITAAGLECDVGMFATEIRGPQDRVFSLIKNLFESAEKEGAFILEVKLSNICGCKI